MNHVNLSETEWVDLRRSHAHPESPNEPCQGQKSSEWIRKHTTHILRVQMNHIKLKSSECIWGQTTHNLRVQIKHVRVRSRLSAFESRPRTSWESQSTMSSHKSSECIWEQTTHKLRVHIHQVRVRNRVNDNASERRSRTIWESKLSGSEVEWVDSRANHALAESPNQSCHVRNRFSGFESTLHTS